MHKCLFGCSTSIIMFLPLYLSVPPPLSVLSWGQNKILLEGRDSALPKINPGHASDKFCKSYLNVGSLNYYCSLCVDYGIGRNHKIVAFQTTLS